MYIQKIKKGCRKLNRVGEKIKSMEIKKMIEKINDIEVAKKPFSLLEMLYKQVYGKEVVQSQMFAGLLCPNENHGHDDFEDFELAESFLRKIGVKVELQKDSNLQVETERNADGRRIDILISWNEGVKKRAVIIENKLNNAQNQPNALNHYHKAIVGEGYEVDKIVYMPLSKERQKAKYTGTDSEILKKTIDFDAQDIVDWLGEFLDEWSCCNSPQYDLTSAYEYYKFLNCLISNQHIIQTAIKIQEELSTEEMIEKFEKLAEITRTKEWCEARFRPIVEQIQKGEDSFARKLIVKYKQRSGDYINYAQFYFDNYADTFWYEVWLYPNDGIYLYKYDGKNYTEVPPKFESSAITELADFLIPRLQELSNSKTKN